MSIKLMAEVWTLDLSHPEQAILLSLADHAKDDGSHVYPSVGLTAWKSGYSERQVQRIIKRLCDSGILILVAEASRHRPREYRIDISQAQKKAPYKPDSRGDKLSPLADSRGDMADGLGVTSEAVRGDIALSPESPLLNHQVNPLKESLLTTDSSLNDDDDAQKDSSSSANDNGQKPHSRTRKKTKSKKPLKSKTRQDLADPQADPITSALDYFCPGSKPLDIAEAAAEILRDGLGGPQAIEAWALSEWPRVRPSNATRDSPWPSQVVAGLRRKRERERRTRNLFAEPIPCADCDALTYPEDSTCPDCGRVLDPIEAV